MEIEPTDELKRGYQLAKIIGIAMIGSLFAYVVIVELTKMNSLNFKGFVPFDKMASLRYVFFGMAVVEFFLIRFIKNRILSGKDIRPKGPGDKTIRSFSPKTQRLISTAIVSYAFCESVAIFGLILFLIGGSSFDFYIFLVLSLIFLMVYFPRYSQWEEGVKAT